MAFTASLLAVAAATLSYFVERDADETKVIQYYLSTQCYARGKVVLDEIMDLWGSGDFFKDLESTATGQPLEGNADDVDTDGHDGESVDAPTPNSLRPISTNSVILDYDKHDETEKHLTKMSLAPQKGTTVRNGITLKKKTS